LVKTANHDLNLKEFVMFNLGKKEVSTQEEMKDKAVSLVANVKNDVLEVTDDVKKTANNVSQKVQQSSKEAKQEALNLIDSLKALLTEYTAGSKATAMKDQFVEKAVELKGVVEDEVAQAYARGKERTTQTVQDKPLLSLAVVLGAGVLVGYILGSKQSSK
jgi:ElaB/YqjD/DUF883 family membrane-anchored ribosome-binding protein